MVDDSRWDVIKTVGCAVGFGEKRQRAATLHDASRGREQRDVPPGFGVRQPSAAFPRRLPMPDTPNRTRCWAWACGAAILGSRIGLNETCCPRVFYLAKRTFLTTRLPFGDLFGLPCARQFESRRYADEWIHVQSATGSCWHTTAHSFFRRADAAGSER